MTPAPAPEPGDNGRIIIRLSIKPESLPDLLAGPFVSRHCLTPDPELEGVYRYSAVTPSDASSEGMLRALSELATGAPFPDPPEPSADVADATARWREWFASLEPAE